MPLIFYLRNVQCRPFHPWLQTQVPFLHWPCSAQRASHGFWSHLVPVQSSLHLKITYLSDTQTPNLFFSLQSIVTSIYVTLITFANLILTSIFRCHHIQLFIKFVIFFLRDKRKSAFEGSTYTIQDQCSEGVLHNFWRKMRSALSSKCKIDFLSAEPFRKAGKRHGFRQVPNSSCRGGNFLRLRTLFHGTRGERETRKASTLEYEKGDLLSCPWFWQRNVGKVGRSFE